MPPIRGYWGKGRGGLGNGQYLFLVTKRVHNPGGGRTRLRQGRIVYMAPECHPGLAVLGALEEPVPESAPPKTPAVSEGVVGGDHPEGQIHTYPRVSVVWTGRYVDQVSR